MDGSDYVIIMTLIISGNRQCHIYALQVSFFQHFMQLYIYFTSTQLPGPQTGSS